MLYVKMMSDEDMPDESTQKCYQLLPVGDHDELSFYSTDGGESKCLDITKQDGTVITRNLIGNVYVMNESGKTIASQGC